MKVRIFAKASAIGVILAFLFTSLLNAQGRTVTGTVTDAKTGEALPGVNIVIKGTSKGTITNIKGKYSIEVSDPNTTLEFSFVGYVNENIQVGNKSVVDVSLVENIMSLNQVVLVGYGSQKKSDLTGAVSVVNAQDMQKAATSDISEALQGQTSGVQVHSSGEPGAVPIVNIRGIGSFTNAAPLYVVDGVPLANTTVVGAGQDVGNVPSGGISDLSPDDIASIQILKDASAAAIYGSRGANGVVIITTKHGQKGKMRVSFDASYGWQNIVKRMKLTDRAQFQQMNNMANRNDGLFIHPGNDSASPYFITNINTDWQKAAFTTGHITNNNLAISGGGENSTYHININYFDQTGTLVGPGPRYKRYTATSLTTQQRGKFKFTEKLSFINSYQIRLTNSQWGNPIFDILSAIPTVPVYDPANIGGYGGASDTVQGMISANEVAFNNLKHTWGKRNRFIGVFTGSYEIIPGLTYKVNLNYDRGDFYNHEFVPKFNVGSREINDIAYLQEWRGENPYMVMEHTLTFDKTLGKNHLTLLGGYSAQKDYFEQVYGYAQGYSEPYFEVLSAGTSGQTTTGQKFVHTLLSYFGRVNYSYDDQILFNLNFRRDGSSRFGPQKKWGNFPSLSVGWKINKAKFFNVDFINLLKLRAGYGLIGNENIGDYLYETYINNNVSTVFGEKGTLNVGATQINLANPSVHWETRITKDIGIDMAMFANKIQFSADYYSNDAKDILYAVPIPTSTGSLAAPETNAASMTNSGLEFNVSYRKLEGDFHYTISANLSTLKNKVTSLGRNGQPVTTGMSQTVVGGSMGELYGYKMVGIFQNQQDIDTSAFQTAYTKPGDVKFKDVNGDGVINTSDRVPLGKAFPSLTGGMNVDLQYKGFDLSVFMHWSYGNKVDNGEYALINAYKEGNYSLQSYNNYWRGEGTTNQYPRLTRTDANGNNKFSQRFVQNGSYFRVQTVQLQYDLNHVLLRNSKLFSSFKIFVAADNLFTFTKYTGYDPDFTNGGFFYRGLDNGSYPSPRTFKTGLKVNF